MSSDTGADDFSLVADLGCFTVVTRRAQDTYLGQFRELHSGDGVSFDDNFLDENFLNPSCSPKVGNRLHVSIFQGTKTKTSAQCMDFLRAQGAVFLGAHGIALVFDYVRDQLPKDMWCTSFDEPDRLWKNTGGYHKVPHVHAYSEGGFHFGLGTLELTWSNKTVFFCFRIEEADVSGT